MNPADLTLSLSPTLTTKTLPTPQSSAQKHGGKAPVPRIELEPIATALKAALGEGWTEYKTAVSSFLLGNINQAELSYVINPLLSPALTVLSVLDPARPATSTLHLHNQFLVCLYANVYRDAPPSEVASWVVATDKPASTSKNGGAGGAGGVGGSDEAEERLKREVMGLHPRDRRRLKMVKENASADVDAGLKEMMEYHDELAVKPPTANAHANDVPPSAGGMALAKGNWDIETRRRYAQPLAAETLEFPTLADLQSRIEPICAEEGLPTNTTGMHDLAGLVEQATEVYLKEMIGTLWSHVRADGVGEGTVQTSAFRKRLRKEEEEVERGVVQRNALGLLPVELEVQARRMPLEMEDLRVGLGVGDGYLRGSGLLGEGIWLERFAD
ncbi:hypothetical protein BAUCODRAFT_48874, partial [Baudoinia panamericana UAMH 10762]